MDNYSVMMGSSAHGVDVVRKSLINGMKGHDRKVERCIKEGKDFHRCAASSAQSRKSKKLTQKSNWFRTKGEEGDNDDKVKGGVEQAKSVRDGGYRGDAQGYRKQGALEMKNPRVKFERDQTPSTVLFVEFSKGGSLQKTVRAVVDRLKGLLGFTIRVTERGGMPLSSLLSSKNLWRGLECGRGECRVCVQPGEKLEDCKRRNILYESECLQCNGPEDWKTRDKNTLEDTRETPSIYVGESARSLCERTGEHWGDALGGNESSHMLEHQGLAHGGTGELQFNFRIVRAFKTSLDRQIAEAIRIHKRGGGILNRKGEFNRCSLTRLVLDNKWEREKWEKAWEVREWGGEDAEFALAESKKTRPENQLPRPRKKRKVEAVEGGPAWGEPMGEESLLKIDFLTSENTLKGGQKAKQSKIHCLTGVSWSAYEIVREILKSAVQVSEDFDIMRGWGDWGDPPVLPKGGNRKELWGVLDEMDQRDFENLPKTQKAVTKTPKNAKKRGRPAKNTQIVGQKTMDMFVVRVRKDDVVQAVSVSNMAQSDGMVADLPGRGLRSIRNMAQEGGNSARTGGAEEGNIILTKRSGRDSVLFDDEVQTIETEASLLLGGSTHTSLGNQLPSISPGSCSNSKENPADDD